VATVHFVKDGKRANGDRITRSVDVPAVVAAKKLGHREVRYTATPPTINPDVRASDWTDYKHVIPEIGSGEETPPFSKPGYYYIIGLAPAEYERLIDR
jgi:hypothetical protein